VAISSLTLQLAWMLLLAATSAGRYGPDVPARLPVATGEHPFEIASNKPYVQVTINGSAPNMFIFDTGCAGGSVIARECADRLRLGRGAEESQHLGAGAGVDVGVATVRGVTLGLGGDTLSAPEFRVFSLAHVEPFEGRRVDGLLGEDFLRRHVVQFDYAKRKVRILDPRSYVPDAKATVVPIDTESGLAVAEGSVALPGRSAIPCRLVIDTGVRATVIFYHPFSVANGLLDASGRAVTATIGGGAGGETRGDLGRVDRLSVGGLTFAKPVALFSRDTVGVFAQSEPDGIVGGELLRRCRVTFDYPGGRLVLEPYAERAPFVYDMSGTFLIGGGGQAQPGVRNLEPFDQPDFSHVVIFSVAERTPAAECGLEKGDEIVSIDGRPAVEIGVEGARELFRRPARYRLEIRRGAERLRIELATRRLI